MSWWWTTTPAVRNDHSLTTLRFISSLNSPVSSRTRPQKGDAPRMKENAGRIIAIAVIVVIGMILHGTCPSIETPAIDPHVLNHQFELVNQSLDTMQEEVAAARAPSHWPFVLFLLSILA